MTCRAGFLPASVRVFSEKTADLEIRPTKKEDELSGKWVVEIVPFVLMLIGGLVIGLQILIIKRDKGKLKKGIMSKSLFYLRLCMASFVVLAFSIWILLILYFWLRGFLKL